MRVLSFCLLLGFIPFSVNAQYRTAGVSFISVQESIRSYALGNSTVAFTGSSAAHHLNPASLSHNRIPTVSFSRYTRKWRSYSENIFTNVYAGYTIGPVDMAASLKHFRIKEEEIFGTLESKHKEYLVNFTASYNVGNGLRVGAGVNYIYSQLLRYSSIYASDFEPDKTFSFDLGIQYQKKATLSSSWHIIPAVGASLTDFGEAVSYNDDFAGDPLPMKLRLGTGIELISTKRTMGLNTFTGTLSLALSKPMVRREIQVSRNNDGTVDSSYVPMKPFKALFKSWDTYHWSNGQAQQSDLGEQIWSHVGLEGIFLETFAIRLGYQDAGQPDKGHSFRSIGGGINLGYLQFDYAYIHDIESGPNRNSNHWQFTARIPLDGHKPDSILHHLFNF
ncbi:PorV/PorQ family protein [Gracilimonas mengyeensis]|uniref:Long-chain fatty acid transport protein n=1 Tax=Gracilimonas mengyeensis TaxID=1302730 RepID=A0A521F0J3_9BACT|nr:PorV/PorQ family protein [Gracilimonas mengyeensis]SMO89663.1 hypothetical protein SAMN06265219_11487 [Gracilimonas mengyeensis]